MSEPVISLRGVTAELGSRPVLRGIDLTVHRGEVVALLGANGSGKSTAIRSVIGQVTPSGGEIEIFGTPRRRFRDWKRVGYVPQRTTAAGGVPATVTEIVASGRLSVPASACCARPTTRPYAMPWSSSAWRTAPRTR